MYFNPRLPCGRRHSFVLMMYVLSTISIHAFRVEGDAEMPEYEGVPNISIHAFRVEGDENNKKHLHQLTLFQSTPSVWKATMGQWYYIIVKKFQSTPSVWKATYLKKGCENKIYNFNPRLPCGRRRSQVTAISHLMLVFQSTPSVWKATAKVDRGFA